MKNVLGPTDIILETQYLPEVSVFATVRSYSRIVINAGGLFRKSSGMNRCRIGGANGPILLSVPVEGGRNVHKHVKDVRISNGQPWQRIHWGSIFSAYGRSPYFLHYEHLISLVYKKQFTYLLDLNTELLAICLRLLNMKIEISHDSNIDIEAQSPVEQLKLTSIIAPVYPQVFESRHGFQAGLSIIDLIFNVGPDSGKILNTYDGIEEKQK